MKYYFFELRGVLPAGPVVLGWNCLIARLWGPVSREMVGGDEDIRSINSLEGQETFEVNDEQRIHGVRRRAPRAEQESSKLPAGDGILSKEVSSSKLE